LKSRVEAACVVASCVRADSNVAMRIWNGSSAWLSEIFSTAGSSMPVIACARDRMVRSTSASLGLGVAN
jgi:hypothetical protein